MSEPAVTGQPARVLGAFDATCIVIGAIIGVGIFFTPSKVVAATGDGGLALLAWGIAGFIALCGALVFAELGRRYNASGAQYEVLRDAFGPCPAFLFVFCNATAIQAGAAAIIAVICAQNLIAVGGGVAPGQGPVVAIAGLLVGGVIVANAIGVRWGSRIQNLTVIAKVAALLAIATLAVLWGSEPVLGPVPVPVPVPVVVPVVGARSGAPAGTLSPLAGVLAALVPAFFAYGGWQHALWISGEVRDPGRNLPRAIIGGVVLVVAVYLLTAWSTLRLLGPGGVAGSTALAADAVGVVSPGVGRRVIAGAVAVSAFGVLNAQLLSGPRLVFGMARDGRFFRPFARLSPRGTPVAAILLIGLIALGLLALSLFVDDLIDAVLNGVVFIDGVFFALTAVALLVLRRRPAWRQPGADGKAARGMPWVPAVAVLFLLGEVGLVIGSYVDPAVRAAAVVGVGWIVAAGVVYAIWFRRRTSALA